jgi:uncharacterized membrane protein YeiH
MPHPEGSGWRPDIHRRKMGDNAAGAVPGAHMFALVITTLDWFGVAVFAVTGALVASRKQMDIFGFALLATVTGIGGGSLRDLLLGQAPVFWVKEPLYVGICVAVAVVVFFTAHIPESRYRLLMWLDAVGLAFFCVVGAGKGLVAGPYIAVVMAVITASFGGIIRDVIGGESPFLLRKEIYVTAALAGAVTFVGGIGIGIPDTVAAIAGFVVCLVIRGLGLVYGLSLPTYRTRPGRTAEELKKIGL